MKLPVERRIGLVHWLIGDAVEDVADLTLAQDANWPSDKGGEKLQLIPSWLFVVSCVADGAQGVSARVC